MTQDEITERMGWAPMVVVGWSIMPVTTTTPVTGGTVQQTGWLCPACGGGNAPFVQRCPCKGWPKMEGNDNADK
jgi:hypothetical protein